MTTIRRAQILSLLLIGMLAFAVNVPAAAGPEKPVAVNPRLVSVEKLVEGSSAARMVAEAGNAEADIGRARARDLLDEARQLSAAGGSPQQIDLLLDDATREMMSAVRLVKGDGRTDPAVQKEIAAMTASLSALLDAYVRIRTEQGTYSDKDELHLLVEDRLAQAERLNGRGDPCRALESLEEAYTATRIAIEHLRGGETLVRSLHFESPAAEYDYEIDRNDSLRMLVNVLLKDRIANNERLARQVQTLVEKASTLRNQAENEADAQQYTGAISTLETSTSELIRAIRSAGIYIPQ